MTRQNISSGGAVGADRGLLARGKNRQCHHRVGNYGDENRMEDRRRGRFARTNGANDQEHRRRRSSKQARASKTLCEREFM